MRKMQRGSGEKARERGDFSSLSSYDTCNEAREKVSLEREKKNEERISSSPLEGERRKRVQRRCGKNCFRQMRDNGEKGLCVTEISCTRERGCEFPSCTCMRTYKRES